MKKKWLKNLFFAVFLQGMKPNHAVARVADIILVGPAGGARPPAAQDALPEFAVCERLVAEVAQEPGETPGVLVRGFALFPHSGDITLQAGDKVLAVLLVAVTSRGSAFPDFQSVPPSAQGWCPSPSRMSLTKTSVFRRLQGPPLSPP